MRSVIVGLALIWAGSAHAADVWDAGVWDAGVWDAGVWDEEVADVAVPDVIGEADSTAADMILEGEGLDLGSVTERCSDAADDEVVGQSPAPGALVDLGSLVDILVSNGVECPNIGGTGVRINGLRMKGL